MFPHLCNISISIDSISNRIKNKGEEIGSWIEKKQIHAKYFNFPDRHFNFPNLILSFKSWYQTRTVTIDDAPYTFYLTHRHRTRSRPFRMNSCCSFPTSETNVIRKFPITCRRRNFSDGQNSFLGIFSRLLRISDILFTTFYSLVWYQFKEYS